MGLEEIFQFLPILKFYELLVYFSTQQMSGFYKTSFQRVLLADDVALKTNI